MTSLLSHLQSATGPSREFDAEIALANGWTLQKLKSEDGRGGNIQPYWRKPGQTAWYIWEKGGPPRYTESIDAALTLVPEGKHWKIGIDADGITYASVQGSKRIWEHAHTPAIALLIAIERAKEKA